METPVTLNSLLSAWILHEKNSEMQLSSLIDKSSITYDYMKSKNHVKTYMTVKPMANLVTKHVGALGFPLTKKTKKDATIVLSLKEEDLKVQLQLAHYSMQLLPTFLLEGCLSIFLKNEVLTPEYYQGKPLIMKPLIEIIKLYDDLFRNEHFNKYDMSKETFFKRLSYFTDRGTLEISEDRKYVKVMKRDETLTLIDFFSNLIQPLIDTYIITLMAIESICGKNLVLKERKIINELHQGIKTLYGLGVIPAVHSCLMETIRNAIERFEQLGLLQIRAYTNAKGTATFFLQCPAESKPKISQILDQIIHHRKYTKEQQDAMFGEVDEAIMRVQGPLPILPRL